MFVLGRKEEKEGREEEEEEEGGRKGMKEGGRARLLLPFRP